MGTLKQCPLLGFHDCMQLLLCLLVFWEGKANSNRHISVCVFTPCFDWVTKSWDFPPPLHKHENVKYITTKLICAHKLVNYVNSESQNSVSLALTLRQPVKVQSNLQSRRI